MALTPELETCDAIIQWWYAGELGGSALAGVLMGDSPFGFGLSYTTFTISKPVYKNNKVRVTVKNTGARKGLETVQVYVRNMADKQGPLKTLKAYKQVEVEVGESKVVDIDLPRNSFEGWDEKTNTMRVVPGKYELMVGSSSADKDCGCYSEVINHPTYTK